MPNLRLTDISVRALKGSDKYVTYWDDTTPAFGIRVGKRSKTWTVMKGRDRERITIGRYPDLSVAEARAEAKKVLSANDDTTKAQKRTFSEARKEFVEQHYRDKSDRQKYLVERALKRHFKTLDHMQLADIEDTHISRCLDKLADRPSEQLHAFRYLRTMLRWCLRPPRRYVRHSPMEGYDPPGQDRKGTRTLTDDELRAVWNAACTPRLSVFRVMIMWGTRNAETCALERIWRFEDVLTIPGEHTKNGRDHSIPVGPLADQVLTAAGGNNQHYFAGRHGIGHLTTGALGKLKREVMTASGTSGWQLRDLRRTFRSNMARLGVTREVCEVLINHAPPVLDEIYDKYDRLAEKASALTQYEGFLVRLLAQGQPERRDAP